MLIYQKYNYLLSIHTYIAVSNIAHRIVFIDKIIFNMIHELRYWYSTSAI